MHARTVIFFKVFILLMLFNFSTASIIFAEQSSTPGAIERINVEDARIKTESGDALLVCSYEDETCKEILLEGAVLLSEFESRLPSLSKNQEIIFYCS
jgi:hypothetical protein